MAITTPYGLPANWAPDKPRLRPLRRHVTWLVPGLAVALAAWVLPGFSLERDGSAFLVAAAIAVVNAVLPPIIAAVRLPFTLLAGFILVLLADAFALRLAADALPDHVRV